MGIYSIFQSIKNRNAGGYDLYGRKIIRKWVGSYGWRGNPSILDLGCGQGDDLSIVKSIYPSSNLYGVDIPGLKNTINLDNIKSIYVNLESQPLPFDDSTFELVIANQVFEHLKNWAWALMESARVLKHGGRLIIGVPNLASLHNRILLLMGRHPTCISLGGMHVRGFTADGLKQVFDAHDVFKIHAIAGAGFYPLPATAANLFSTIFPESSATIYFECIKAADYHLFKNMESIDRLSEMQL